MGPGLSANARSKALMCLNSNMFLCRRSSVSSGWSRDGEEFVVVIGLLCGPVEVDGGFFQSMRSQPGQGMVGDCGAGPASGPHVPHLSLGQVQCQEERSSTHS